MGSLTPGATYIYERVGTEIYAREMGKTERILIGYDYKGNDPLDHRHYMSTPSEAQLWHNIRMTATENKALANILEQALTIYYTIKEHDTGHKERT
jgi:hypothetical protein